MLKTILSVFAFAFVAWSAGAIVPTAAHADTCGDLQAVSQHPLAANPVDPNAAAEAAQIGTHAQQLLGILCPGGAAADTSAPAHTPAQITDPNLASACPPYTDAPTPPSGLTHAQLNTHVTAFNAWVATNNQTMTCHHNEIAKMQRDADVYDAAVLVWQQHLVAQMMQLQADFSRAQGNASRRLQEDNHVH